MYGFGKALKESLLSSGTSWTINEAILTMGQATADNLPAGIAQIMYFVRVPTIEMAEHVVRGLDHYAESAARVAALRLAAQLDRRNRVLVSPTTCMARATLRQPRGSRRAAV